MAKAILFKYPTNKRFELIRRNRIALKLSLLVPLSLCSFNSLFKKFNSTQKDKMACRFLPFVLIGTILFVPATLCETVWSDLLMDEGMALPPVSESTAFLREPLIVNGSLVDLVHVFPGYRRWSLTEKFVEIENQVFNLVKTPRYHKEFFAELGTFLKPNATGTYSPLNAVPDLP